MQTADIQGLFKTQICAMYSIGHIIRPHLMHIMHFMIFRRYTQLLEHKYMINVYRKAHQVIYE